MHAFTAARRLARRRSPLDGQWQLDDYLPRQPAIALCDAARKAVSGWLRRLTVGAPMTRLYCETCHGEREVPTPWGPLMECPDCGGEGR